MPPAKARGGKKSARRVVREQEPELTIPLEQQQRLLNVFKDAFSERLKSDFKPLLQEVKGHLFNRDFSTAFGRIEYLETYAARWSPSRALGYLHILSDLGDVITPSNFTGNENEKSQIVCLGGGAGAEIVAFSGWLNQLLRVDIGIQPRRRLDIAAIDIADWTAVVEKLQQNIITIPPLSKYASAAAQAASSPLLHSDDLNITFHQHDVLSTDIAVLRPLLQGANLVTILFTLNELYSTSLSMTQKFLHNLTASLHEGALLLVVDSPGSYSTVTLNGAEKKYPMQWLLDHTLLKQGAKGESPAWTKVNEDDSKWFRLSDELRYPIDLENMRFQLHLYRRAA